MKITNIIFVVGLQILFSSCASLFNTRHTSVVIKTHRDVKIVSVENSVERPDDNTFLFARSSDSLKIKINADSNKYTLKLPARKSFVYWEKLLNLGIGFFIDNKSNKRYSYPRRLYIERSDTAFKIVRHPTLKKGSIEIRISSPYVNTFNFKKNNKNAYTSGFEGVALGAGYCYKDKKYISLNFGIALNFAVPFPVPLERFGPHETFTYYFVNINNNFRVSHFDFGYGINYSRSEWRFSPGGGTPLALIGKGNSGLGLNLGAKYYFARIFTLGLIYQPNILELNSSPAFRYQDFISIEAGANFLIHRPKRKTKP